MMVINRVGILGAGTMGGGIAQVIAQAGLQVAILDLSEALVIGGVEKIEKNLSRSVEKRMVSPFLNEIPFWTILKGCHRTGRWVI